MSRTNIDAPTQAALLAAHVTQFVLVEFGFDSGTVYLADLPFDVTISGTTYVAAQGIGTIEPVVETDKEAKGLTFSMSAVGQAAIASALTEPVQGRSILMKLAIVDGTTLRIDPCIWSGKFDVMSIDDNGQTPVIRVTGEHQLISWQQPKGALASDADQKLRSAGDKFFEYAAQMAEATIAWPGAEFFRQG